MYTKCGILSKVAKRPYCYHIEDYTFWNLDGGDLVDVGVMWMLLWKCDVVQVWGAKRTWNADDDETICWATKSNLSPDELEPSRKCARKILRARAHAVRCTVYTFLRARGDCHHTWATLQKKMKKRRLPVLPPVQKNGGGFWRPPGSLQIMYVGSIRARACLLWLLTLLHTLLLRVSTSLSNKMFPRNALGNNSLLPTAVLCASLNLTRASL